MRTAQHLLPLVALVALFIGCNGDEALVFPALPAPTSADALTYAGSEACRTCHEAIYETWEKSRHTKKVRRATAELFVNDADSDSTNDFVEGGAGATFDVAGSVPAEQTTFDDYTLDPGVEFPKLGFNGTNYVIRIGPVTYPVTFVLGGTGKWKQRYMVTIDNQEYISPVQYNDITREYVPYHPEHWYVLDAATKTLQGYLYNSAAQTPVTEGKIRNSWQRRCIGCHVMGVRDVSLNAVGEYGASIEEMLSTPGGTGPHFTSLEIGCEACHGPSARHVELGGGVGTALNPADMASNRSDEVCGSCHTRGSSVNSEGFGYPWAAGSLVEGQYRPGDVLANFYNDTPYEGSRFWDDGAFTASSHHQQWLEHKETPHFKAGVTCVKCHAPHGSGIEGDLLMEPTQLCLSCHDGKGNIDSTDLSLHTRHADPETNACNNCHFNLTAKSGIKYDVHSHTYRIIFPVETETTPGLPNSCAKCHRDETTAELTGMLSARWPDIHPVAYARSEANPFGVGFRLRANKAFDPLGGALAYEWTFKSGPPTFSQDQLIGATSDTALFVPSAPGKYVFNLVVTNEDGLRSWIGETSVDVPVGVQQTTPDLTQSTFVGSAECSRCHGDTHADWEITRHPQKTRRPFEGAGVAFIDTDDSGVSDWLQGSFNMRDDPDPARNKFDDYVYDPGVEPPVIFFQNNTYKVTIGPITYDVTFILGGTGKWKQRYMATIGEGEYILPMQYNEITKEWVNYHVEHWYTFIDANGDGDADPGETLTGYLFNAGQTPVTQLKTRNSWQRRCTYCHSTGAVDMTRAPNGEYGASIETMLAATTGPRLAEIGIGCEACHGPGSQHVDMPSLRGAIVNPSKLSSRKSNEVCGACHNRGSSVNSEGFGYPWGANLAGGNFLPGVHELKDFYKPVDEVGSRFWADPFGHAKSHHQQWLDMRWSRHFTKAGMTCGTCHTGHNEKINGQLKIEEVKQCTACHQGFKATNGEQMLNHSRHLPGQTKCSDCHMPFTAKSAIPGDVRAHSWQVIWPAATDSSGIPNSCTKCHPTATTTDLQDDINWMWGDMVPYAEPRVMDPSDGKIRRSAEFNVGATVTLDGTKSYDPNGEPIATYAWSLMSAPDDSTAKLSSRLLPRPTVVVDLPGTYVFSLVVRDLRGSSRTEKITITVTDDD